MFYLSIEVINMQRMTKLLSELSNFQACRSIIDISISISASDISSSGDTQFVDSLIQWKALMCWIFFSMSHFNQNIVYKRTKILKKHLQKVNKSVFSIVKLKRQYRPDKKWISQTRAIKVFKLEPSELHRTH